MPNAKKKRDQTKEGRHVGLDFYDLLIEVLYRMRLTVSAQVSREVGRDACDTAV